MVETVSRQRCFNGVQGFYRHWSDVCQCTMAFAVYEPPAALNGAATPVLTYLAGLTCTPETFTIKAGAQRVAARLGLTLVMPDTSPRGANLPGEDDAFDFGTGAGFYLDATQEPWSKHYRMASYITRELQETITQHFNVDPNRQGIFGHSMGGHGALTLHFHHPGLFRTVSAFAPVSAPMRVQWGDKAFSNYLGDDQAQWREHDASELVKRQPTSATILVDQGTDDQFLRSQLVPEVFSEAAVSAGQPLQMRMQPGYDHSYYFIQTFVEDHLIHHHAGLTGA